MNVNKAGDDDQKQYDIPTPESVPIESLPDEVLHEIFSKLDNPLDLQSSTLVKRKWSIESIALARKEFYDIKNFGEFLIKKLNPELYSEQINEINKITADAKIFDLISVIDILSSCDQQKIILSHLLKGIEDNDLNALKVLCDQQPLHPEIVKDVFYAAKIFKEVDKADSDDDLIQIINDIDDDYFELAIEVAKLLGADSYVLTMRALSKTLEKKPKISSLRGLWIM